MNKKNKILLSLCIITKNEEKTLPLCLESVKGIVDEIIVVDTGSLDQTVRIAKQAGAKVFKSKWNNDFSHARNRALEEASGKWVLFLDADESISRKDVQKIRPLLQNPMVEGYLFYILTNVIHYESSSPTPVLRLFRNRKEYRYVNRVFECIPHDVLTSTKDVSITILHQPDPERFINMNQLKMELLYQLVQEKPTDSYLRYVYGIQLLNENKLDESVEQFKVAIQHIHHSYVFSPHAYKCLSWALCELQRYEEAIEYVNKGLIPFPFFTDLFYLHGQCHKALGNFAEAIKDFETCLTLGDSPSSMIPEPGVGSYKAYYELGEIHEKSNNIQEAFSFYKKAYDHKSEFTEPLYQIGKLIKENHQLGEIDTVLLEWLDSENSEHMMLLIDILCMEKEYKRALTHTEQVQSKVGMNNEIAFLKGICYSLLGDYPQAEEHYQFINRTAPYYHQVLLRRVQNQWFQNDWQEAQLLIKEVTLSPNVSEVTKEVYQTVHQLLTGEPVKLKKLNDRGSEGLAKLIEHFLFLKQIDHSKLLLHWILQSDQEHLWIPIGEMMIESNDFDTVQAIYQRLKNPYLKSEFKERMAKRILQNEKLEWAEDILGWGNRENEGVERVFSYLLWSKLWCRRTLEIINAGIRSRKLDQESKKNLVRLREVINNEH